jgi:predicted ArsR family transcriptional regulator
MRSLVEDGPATAVALAERVGLTPGAIRRHLDALLADDLIQAGERPPYGPSAPRGRGRPARVYSVTERGRQAEGPSDDELALAVLRYLHTTGGSDAVRDFARSRLTDQQARYARALAEVPPAERPRALAALLTDEGFAATAAPLTEPADGVQLCQHHCPMAGVVAEFGEFCDAESDMFAELLGTHVRRLATLAHGDGVCTTHLVAPTTDAATHVSRLSTSEPSTRDRSHR